MPPSVLSELQPRTRCHASEFVKRRELNSRFLPSPPPMRSLSAIKPPLIFVKADVPQHMNRELG